MCLENRCVDWYVTNIVMFSAEIAGMGGGGGIGSKNNNQDAAGDKHILLVLIDSLGRISQYSHRIAQSQTP